MERGENLWKLGAVLPGLVSVLGIAEMWMFVSDVSIFCVFLVIFLFTGTNILSFYFAN